MKMMVGNKMGLLATCISLGLFACAGNTEAPKSTSLSPVSQPPSPGSQNQPGNASSSSDNGANSLPAFSNPRVLAAGETYTCAIDDDGVKCWGDNSAGESSVPSGLINPIAVSAGSDNTCAIASGGLKCWGSGEVSIPSYLVNPVEVAADENQICALDEQEVKCWGDVPSEQAPVPSGLKNPHALVARGGRACLIDDDGVKCWGSNTYGETSVPSGLTHPRAVALGYMHTCAIDDSGIKCWGRNNEGQTSVPNLINPRAVAAGKVHTCAIDDEGVKCWGADIDSNFEGMLTVPDGIKNPRTLVAGEYHTCVIDDDGVKCWGDNHYGQTAVPGQHPLQGTSATTYVTSSGAIFTRVSGNTQFGPGWKDPSGTVWSSLQGKFTNIATNPDQGNVIVDSAATRACSAIGGRLPTIQDYYSLVSYFDRNSNHELTELGRKDLYQIFPDMGMNTPYNLYWTNAFCEDPYFPTLRNTACAFDSFTGYTSGPNSRAGADSVRCIMD
jgi:Regulator of chromosome condensation (RCC1) repeat